MSPSSTSSSRRILSAFAPFLLALAVPVAAEVVLRALDGARLFARPVKTGLIYMDEKREAFLHSFLPSAKGRGVLILGSSCADTNLDPTLIDQELLRHTGKEHSTFNAALYGTRLSDNRFFLDWYRRHWKFETVIINIEPGILRPGRMPKIQETLGTYGVDMWLRDHSALFRYRDQLRRWKAEDNEATIVFDAETTAAGWNRTLVMPLSSPIDEQLSGTIAPFREWDIDPALLEDIAKWCQERDVDVVWTMMPYKPSVQEAFEGEWRFDNIASIVRGIASRHGQRFADFTALKFPDEDFFDPTHLNARGALKMSSIAGDRIGRMLRDDLRYYAEPAADVGDDAMPVRRGSQVFSPVSDGG